MSTSTLTLAETAQRLKVRETYVMELITKGRLTALDNQCFDAKQVEQLALLLEKLRGNGISALVQAAADGKL